MTLVSSSRSCQVRRTVRSAVGTDGPKGNWRERLTRIAILDRTDMDAEQARVYDTAKETSGIVGGPYYAYIRLPKVFEACQNLRGALASGLLSRREQQIINLVVARH